MTVHVYSMHASIKKGTPPGVMLKKQLLMGAMLYLVGLFCEGIAANWGVIGRSLESGVWRWDQINHVLHFETLNSIAICIIAVSIIYYFMIRNDGAKKMRRNVTIFVVIGIIFVALEPVVQGAVNAAYGGYYYDTVPGESWPAQYLFTNAGEFFLKLFLAMIAGAEQPMFPFFGAACLGAIIGLYLSQEKVPQDFPKRGYFTGLIILVSGVAVAGLTLAFGGDIDPTFTPHEAWFFLVLVGLEVLCYMFVLKHVEFSPKLDMAKFLKRTVWLRRWGIIALSIFVWQIVIEFPIRDLGMLITGLDYHTRGKILDFLPTILMVFAVVFVWNLAVRAWEKGRFIGSFEWIMATLGQRALGGRGKEKPEKAERLNIKQVLYEPEPIVFFEKTDKPS
nr:hypothetical protein [Candidatus Sigynarchaeota archaeon]